MEKRFYSRAGFRTPEQLPREGQNFLYSPKFSYASGSESRYNEREKGQEFA
jgi:hypothetical protein